MSEYFIVANSFAAPIFSDTSTSFQEADTPEQALEIFAKEYDHPAGLYSAVVYESAEAYHKRQKYLARWLCNHEIEKRRLTEGEGSYSYLGHAPGDFEINHVRHKVDNPKKGRVVCDTA